MIVEKKFIKQERSLIDRLKESMEETSSYSTIYMNREDTRSLSAELHGFDCKESAVSMKSYCTFECNQTSVLTYSRSCSQALLEDILPLLKKILTLLSSEQYIRRHVEGSLAMKGYRSVQCVEVGKIVAVSFADYVGLTRSLSDKLSRGERANWLEQVLCDLNCELTNLKMDSILLRQKLQSVQQQNLELRAKLQQMSVDKKKQIMDGVRSQIQRRVERMNSFQKEVYQALKKQQQSLLDLSYLRNKLTVYLSEANTPKSIPKKSNLNQVQLISTAKKLSQQLQVQRSLYDQLLDRNIELQKQLYFAGNRQMENSLTVVDNNGAFGPDGVFP